MSTNKYRVTGMVCEQPVRQEIAAMAGVERGDQHADRPKHRPRRGRHSASRSRRSWLPHRVIPMNAAARLGAYGVGLMLIFGGAVAVSGAVVPETAVSNWMKRAGAGAQGPAGMGGDAAEVTPGVAATDSVRGLSLQEDGYQISSVAVPTGIHAPGERALRITDRHGRALTDYATVMAHGQSP